MFSGASPFNRNAIATFRQNLAVLHFESDEEFKTCEDTLLNTSVAILDESNDCWKNGFNFSTSVIRMESDLDGNILCGRHVNTGILECVWSDMSQAVFNISPSQFKFVDEGLIAIVIYHQQQDVYGYYLLSVNKSGYHHQRLLFTSPQRYIIYVKDRSIFLVSAGGYQVTLLKYDTDGLLHVNTSANALYNKPSRTALQKTEKLLYALVCVSYWRAYTLNLWKSNSWVQLEQFEYTNAVFTSNHEHLFIAGQTEDEDSAVQILKYTLEDHRKISNYTIPFNKVTLRSPMRIAAISNGNFLLFVENQLFFYDTIPGVATDMNISAVEQIKIYQDIAYICHQQTISRFNPLSFDWENFNLSINIIDFDLVGDVIYAVEKSSYAEQCFMEMLHLKNRSTKRISLGYMEVQSILYAPNSHSLYISAKLSHKSKAKLFNYRLKSHTLTELQRYKEIYGMTIVDTQLLEADPMSTSLSMATAIIAVALGTLWLMYMVLRYKKAHVLPNEVRLAGTNLNFLPKSLISIDNTNKIGSGASAKVYPGWFDGMPVAIKKVKEEYTEHFWREIEIMIGLQHENIVHFFGVAFVNKSLLIVMERMAYNLHEWIKKQPKIDISTSYCILHQIACGMQYLHSQEIIHSDLSDRNILIDENKGTLVAKICDFGYSKKGQQTSTNQERGGTVSWMAPECFESRISRRKPVDVYSFAIIGWQLLTKEIPWSHVSDIRTTDIVWYVIKGERPPIPENCSTDLRKLIEECWQQDPSSRPTFDDLEKRTKNCQLVK